MDESTLELPVLVTGGEKPRRIGDLEVAVADREDVILNITYYCDDCYYSFDQHIPLGQILTSLDLTAEDCDRTIEAWKARTAKVAGDV